MMTLASRARRKRNKCLAYFCVFCAAYFVDEKMGNLHAFYKSMNEFSDEKKCEFATEVSKCFGFMIADFGMEQGKARVSGGNDPRDSVLVIRYSRNDLKVDVGWKENEAALILTIRFEHDTLSRLERWVYFEPFIEFLCGERAIVPYFTETMNGKSILAVMTERKKLFSHGLHEVLIAIGHKLKRHFCDLESASAKTIRDYHEWMHKKSALGE